MLRPSSLSLFHLIGICFCGGSSVVSAAAVLVDSYTIQATTGSNYPDTGGKELTDGVTYSRAWTVPSTTITLADVAGLVGWEFRNPVIRFEFGSVQTIQAVTVWAADSDGSAGVGLPKNITLRTPDHSFSQTFSITNPSGNGYTVPLFLSGFSVNTSSLIVEAERNHSWTMFSEIQFDSVPEVSSLALVGLAGVGFLARRRRVGAPAIG